MISEFRGPHWFLSNFYHPCDIDYEGIAYSSSEAAYQAAKSDDNQVRLWIAAQAHPKLAKMLGRNLVLPSSWNERRLIVMEEILIIKFSDQKLRERLRATGKQPLVEGNTWGDRFWGVCRGEGRNHLGQLLMKIRSRL